jgi:hypothetical protein
MPMAGNCARPNTVEDSRICEFPTTRVLSLQAVFEPFVWLVPV